MSANTVPTTSWSSQLTTYFNMHLGNVHGEEKNWRNGDPDEPCSVFHSAVVIAGATSLTIVAAVETAALGALSLVLRPTSDKHYRFVAERLESSAFTVVWNLYRLRHCRMANVCTNELNARFMVDEERFARPDKDYAALIDYPSLAGRAYHVANMMEYFLDTFCHPHQSGWTPDQEKMMFAYDASLISLDFVVDIAIRGGAEAHRVSVPCLKETKIKLKLLERFQENRPVSAGDELYVGFQFGVIVKVTAEDVALYNALKSGAKTEAQLLSEIKAKELRNPALIAVHKMLADKLPAARVERGAEILANEVFDDCHPENSGFHANVDQQLSTGTVADLIEAFKTDPRMKDFVLARILMCHQSYRQRNSNLRPPLPAEVALFFDKSVQESICTVMNASGPELLTMGRDSNISLETRQLALTVRFLKNDPDRARALSEHFPEVAKHLNLDQSFLLTHCWGKAAEILDQRLTARRVKDAIAAAPRYSLDVKDSKDS